MKKAVLVFTLASGLLLGGCQMRQTVDHQMVAEPDPVALKLASAVDRASAALTTLASVEQARAPAVSANVSPDVPAELKRTITIEWSGPIEPVLRRLAERAGYGFTATGDRPPVPVVVNVTSYQRPLIDVMRDVGLQAGQRANVIVDSDRRVVEVNYAPVSGG